ncbi:MAG: non-hydrolyzing UDP-N-acetylglucosamine 2-epimerase [Pseudomonadota bacterium]
MIFGTRPEAIKMAPVVAELRRRPELETFVCITAQHREMLDQVLDLFALTPDFDLDLMQQGQSLEDLTARILTRLGAVIDEVAPHRVLVHGDTTTSFAAALAAFYRRIPVGHVEAGLRTGDIMAPWPEEMNRRCVDSIADLLWAPTTRAADTLRREGAPEANIIETGNTVIDALLHTVSAIDADPAVAAALAEQFAFLDPARRLILVTGHRRENFDGGLDQICEALERLAGRPDVEVLWPVHPNPVVRRTVQGRMSGRANVHLIAPQDYRTFTALMRRAHLIITDSGGIQEEAPSLGKPVLVTRDQTERPEAVAAGTALLVGARAERIVAAADRLLDDPARYRAMAEASNPFGDGRASQRIAESIVRRDAPADVRR